MPAGDSYSKYFNDFKRVSLDFSNVTTAQEYAEALAKRVELVQSNVAVATFTRDGVYTAAQYDSNSGLDLNSRSAIASLRGTTPLYTFKLYKKPKTIKFDAKYNNRTDCFGNDSGYALWGIQFKGGTTGRLDTPVCFIDTDSMNKLNNSQGLFINNERTMIKPLVNGINYWTMDIDLARDCPSCFTTQEEYYLVSVYSALYSPGTWYSHTPLAPVYISNLTIE